MPSEYVPLGAAGGSALIALITLVASPALKAWIERRAHDQGGWTEAVKALKTQVLDLREEVDGLRAELGGLRVQLSERDQTIASQSHSLARANGRVRQLELAWPPGYSMPAPDAAGT